MNDELFKEVCIDALSITFKIIDAIDFTTDEQGTTLRKIAFKIILEKALLYYVQSA